VPPHRLSPSRNQRKGATRSTAEAADVGSDPVRPWTGEYPWVAGIETIYDYACFELINALAIIRRGAR